MSNFSFIEPGLNNYNYYNLNIQYLFLLIRREPASRVRPPKTNAQPTDLTQYEKNLESATPTATRHIILIRHGQYFDTAVEDKDRFLTELGN